MNEHANGVLLIVKHWKKLQVSRAEVVFTSVYWLLIAIAWICCFNNNKQAEIDAGTRGVVVRSLTIPLTMVLIIPSIGVFAALLVLRPLKRRD